MIDLLTIGFAKNSFVVPALNISLTDSSKNSEFLKAEELLLNSVPQGVYKNGN